MSTENLQQFVFTSLRELYGIQKAEQYIGTFASLLEKYQIMFAQKPNRREVPLEQHTAILITYADSLRDDVHTPTISVLHHFLQNYVGSAISTIHLLPFYPSTSDDGFSVVDPVAVNPLFGTWKTVHTLQEEYLLMFDFVVNHLSRSNAWIMAALQDDPEYKDFIIEMQGDEDLRSVFRPRALPLLTRIGEKLVWTTFSGDQVDVNYHNPKVLLAMTEILLWYAAQGASVVRLDAVAFLWKELGTRCIHHPKTHAIVQFFARILSSLSPGSFLVTETNVPHLENISYFGNGYNEATMVYNFSLPPLVYHTFLSQDATALSSWAKTLVLPSEEVTFFNFLASHDGIGLMPVKGILTESEIEAMAMHAQKQGGFISRKNESDGSTSPYELNINYFSALSRIVEGEQENLAIKRFIAASAIMIFFKGIPGIYIHSLIGSKNWNEAPDLSQHPRRINREKLTIHTLEAELSNPDGRRATILNAMLALLEIRKREVAFSPLAAQQVIEASTRGCFAFLRSNTREKSLKRKERELLVVVNVSAIPQPYPSIWNNVELEEMVSNTTVMQQEDRMLCPYQVVVLKRRD